MTFHKIGKQRHNCTKDVSLMGLPVVFKMSAVFLCLPLVVTLFLTACKDDRAEIRHYIAEIKSHDSKKIESLPKVKNYEPFKYHASNRRSPFEPSKKTSTKSYPDSGRKKEDLEVFPLDALRMVGTMSRNHQKWVLISAPDGVVYRVKKGAYLGKNFGQIISIDDAKVEIRETVPDGLGGWKERPSSLMLLNGKG